MLKEFEDHTGHSNRTIVIGISYITIFVLANGGQDCGQTGFRQTTMNKADINKHT